MTDSFFDGVKMSLRLRSWRQPAPNMNSFHLQKIFGSRKKMIDWVKEIGLGVATVIVIKKSDNVVSGRTGSFLLVNVPENLDQARSHPNQMRKREKAVRRSVNAHSSLEEFTLQVVRISGRCEWNVVATATH